MSTTEMYFEDVVPSEILFQDELYSSEYSHLFLVVVRDVTCVMKVHHGIGPREFYDPDDRELDIHVCESSAYRRLSSHGLCDKGLVPKYFGSMRKFDPGLCEPHLDAFLDDEYPPSAIFMEYIPGLEMIDIDTCTEARFNNMILGIKEIHKALVQHGDPNPRNIMVFKDDPESVVWIDFDRADTYDEDTITKRQRQFLEEEEQSVSNLGHCLVSAAYNSILFNTSVALRTNRN
ncbi:hypothetical protein BJX96DRAFT_102830 [Aspergillus floccosus]